MPLVDHLILTVNDLERSRSAYGWLLPELGYPERHDMGNFTGWFSNSRQHGGQVWIKQAEQKFCHEEFNKDRVGLCELAFSVEGREKLQEIARALPLNGFRLLHEPTEYDYVPGYYAVYFLDPDGIKLEIVARIGN